MPLACLLFTNGHVVLVMLLRLRQICSHTSLITEEEDVIVDDDIENTTEENRDEVIHAQTVVGREFVTKLKTKLKEIWLGRMKAEKEVHYICTLSPAVRLTFYSHLMRLSKMKTVQFALTCSIIPS